MIITRILWCCNMLQERLTKQFASDVIHLREPVGILIVIVIVNSRLVYSAHKSEVGRTSSFTGA